MSAFVILSSLGMLALAGLIGGLRALRTDGYGRPAPSLPRHPTLDLSLPDDLADGTARVARSSSVSAPRSSSVSAPRSSSISVSRSPVRDVAARSRAGRSSRPLAERGGEPGAAIG